MLNVTIVGYLFEIVTSTAKRLSNSLIETIEEILLRAMKRVEVKEKKSWCIIINRLFDVYFPITQWKWIRKESADVFDDDDDENKLKKREGKLMDE
jgi:hypothetical protein